MTIPIVSYIMGGFIFIFFNEYLIDNVNLIKVNCLYIKLCLKWKNWSYEIYAYDAEV